MTETEAAYPSEVSQSLIESVIQTDNYFAANPGTQDSGLDAITHWRQFGQQQGCLPNGVFLPQEWDGFRHLNEDQILRWDKLYGSTDLKKVPMHKRHALYNVLSRYLAEALEESDSILVLMHTEFLCSIFDADFYADDNQLAYLHPALRLRHYLRFGWKNARRPAADYDANKLKTILERRGPSVDLKEARVSFENYFRDNFKRARNKDKQAAHRILKSIGPFQSEEDKDRFSEEEMALFRDYFDAEAFRGLAGLSDDLDYEDVLHLYLNGGWRIMPDTGKGFDASFYVKRYKELEGAQISPLEHYVCNGRAELRQPQSRSKEVARTYLPLVSIIVPNFNHEKFLTERLESIESQTYRNFEVILLDDNSSDKSQDILEKWSKKDHGFSVKVKFNKTNSGNVFSQWERGLELAKGELIWICESDDSCEPDFLETLVPHFADSSINMAVGRIEFIGKEGEPIDGMAGFRQYSEPDIWEEPIVRSAAEWFAGAWGVNNIAANVGGCLFRKPALPDHVFKAAKTYKIAGDWYLYTFIVGSGRMVFDPNASAYFRQHETNTSASNFNRLYYYEELARIRNHLRRIWPCGETVDKRFIGNVQSQWEHYKMKGVLEDKITSFSQVPVRDALHIVIAYLGPRVGGGEIIATHIANALAELSTDKQPIFVSLFAHTLHDPSPILEEAISDKVSVYSVETALEYDSGAAFLTATSADIINSHMCLNDEYFLKKTSEKINIPYAVTMHGSHQGASGKPLENDFLMALLLGVDLWLYTAPQNLKIFSGIPLDNHAVRHMPNAMPADDQPAEFSRESLGISNKAFVFTLVARGIQRKGWRASIEAFLKILQSDPTLDAHLLLIGDGDRVEELREKHGTHKNIHFMGYQTAINGIYRLSDCALLPTRFEGESYPLCLTQALMEGVPAIAGDVGFIRNMMTLDSGKVAGLLIDPVRDTEIFINDLASAMEKLMKKRFYRSSKKIAVSAGKKFAMDDLAKKYLELFSDAIESKKQAQT